MKNNILYIISFCLLFTACTNNFDEINKNPNSAENIDPQFLLSNVVSVLADQNTYYQGFLNASYISQFSASVEFERIDRYEMGSNSDYWNNLFGLLTDIESMKTVEASNDAYVAVGDILKSYIFSQLTDMWGDVPYTEALKAKEGITAPKYDTQESIYMDSETGILAVLEKSAESLSTTTSAIKGDVMFGNNLEKWIRFANSLRVRYTLRISNKISDFSTLQSIVDGGLLMESNADNAIVPYLSAAPNQFPLSQASLGTYQEHRMTQTVDSILTKWDDPRIDALYKPTQASVLAGTPEHKGLLNGQSRETISANNIDLNDISLFGSIYRDIPNGINGELMLYSELQFAIAEAIERGFITGDAKASYENGIKAHFAYLDTDMPEDYLMRESIIFDGNNNLTKTLSQKWLSLINNGHEAWFNVRRTGIPYLKPGPDNLNNGQFPVRYLYPESEQATNFDHYNEAASRMGGDNINSKNWWES